MKSEKIEQEKHRTANVVGNFKKKQHE